MFTKFLTRKEFGVFLVLLVILFFPHGTHAAKGVAYKQSYKDTEIGVTFSYDLKKPLVVTDLYDINGETAIARSFTQGNKEAFYLSLNNKQDTDLFRFGMKLIMLADGEVDDEGNYFEASKSTQKAVSLKNKLEVYNIAIIDEDGSKIGAKIFIHSLKDKKGKEIGSISFSNGWGAEFPESMRQESTYNGEIVSLDPYFSTEKKMNTFLKQILKTIKVDEKAALKAIKDKE